MPTLTVDEKKLEAEEGESVLQVALRGGLEIPHLCYLPGLSPYGGCRLCLVEVTRNRKTEMTTACTYPAAEGLVVRTDTTEIRRLRRLVLELLLPLAPQAPVLQELARQLGAEPGRLVVNDQDVESDDCIRCGLCVRVCQEYVGVSAITFAGRGSRRTIAPPFEEEPQACIGCGACVSICPTGCIKMEDRGKVRRIIRWDRKLEIKTCSDCGRPYIPKAQVDFILQQTLDPPPPEWFERCPDCR